ncbi:MAG: hypothetical protein EBY39_04220 [Flavobacteriia bacterium]|nr:hypothetical protein [Flavobacteriia bacterium]
MAELIQILEGKNPRTETDFSTVQPKLGDTSFFTSLETEIAHAKEEDVFFNDTDHVFHMGAAAGDIDTLVLKAPNLNPNLYDNVFIGYKGSLGPGLVFPYVSEYPKVQDLPDEVISSFFGENALGGNAQPDENTHIRIGDGAENATPSLSNCVERVFVSTIATVGMIPEFTVSLLDLDQVILHAQGDAAIEISDSQIDIYPPAFKRNINVITCGESIARKENSSNDGGLRMVGAQASCVGALQDKGLFPSNSSSTNLVRQGQ